MNLPDRGQFISLHGDRAGPRPCIVRLWSGHSPRILRRSLQVSPAQVQRALLIRKHEDASCRACPGTGRKRPQAGILALALLGRIGLALTVHLVFPFCSSVERGCASHSPRRNSLKEKSAPTAARTAISSGLLDRCRTVAGGIASSATISKTPTILMTTAMIAAGRRPNARRARSRSQEPPSLALGHVMLRSSSLVQQPAPQRACGL